MKNVKAIAAVALNGVIGNGLQIPWHISEDFKHLKKTTTGGIIVMGRKTWQSLGERPLPNRENVVITTTPESVKNAKGVSSLQAVFDTYKNDTRTIWICGGANLYKQALPFCDELILSRVKFSPKGDIFFPPINTLFKKTSILSKHKLFNVVKYIARSKQK